MIKMVRCAVVAFTMLVHQGASAQELADLNKPITLDIHGMELPFVTSLQPTSGLSLDIRMLANKPIGIGTESNGGLPPAQAKAWIVWADPDGCWSFSLGSFGQTCASTDETYLEFSPGRPSQSGSGPALMVNSYQFPPYRSGEYYGNVHEIPLTAHTGGFGHSTAIPALVVLGDTGLAREFTTDPTNAIAQTGKVRNLAGFVDSVTYTVNDRMPFLARTSVTAHLSAGLFAPILFVDYGVCPYTFPNGTVVPYACDVFKWTIDGKPPAATLLDNTAILAYWKAMVTTVRIFVVDGPAPDLVADLNGDHVIDAKDVLKMINPVTGNPYKLLSGERVIKFQTNEDYMFPGIPFDMDGDGMYEPVRPATGGGVQKIPR